MELSVVCAFVWALCTCLLCIPSCMCIYTHTYLSSYLYVSLWYVHLPTVNISSVLLLVGHEHEAAAASPLRPSDPSWHIFLQHRTTGKGREGKLPPSKELWKLFTNTNIKKRQCYKKKQIRKVKTGKTENWFPSRTQLSYLVQPHHIVLIIFSHITLSTWFYIIQCTAWISLWILAWNVYIHTWLKYTMEDA